MTNCCVLFLILTLTGLHIISGDHWTYKAQAKWPGYCKTGKTQSPINIDVDSTKNKSYPPFIFTNYNKEYKGTVKNNGHSVEIRLDNNDNLLVSGGGFPTEYKLDHIHFHWPSEHTVDGHRYPLEMHMVHYSTKFKTLAEAIDKQDGIAVLGVLFQKSPDDDYVFTSISSDIHNVAAKLAATGPITLNPRLLLPRDTGGFFRYIGSLTTPGCNEGLIWTIYSEKIHLSSQQIKSFETVLLDANTKANYRSVQNLNGRAVYYKQSPSGGAKLLSYSMLPFLIVFFYGLTNW